MADNARSVARLVEPTGRRYRVVFDGDQNIGHTDWDSESRLNACACRHLKPLHIQIVSALLGHSGIAITLDIYSHTTSGMLADATAALQDMLTKR
ncbi:MAG TPA: hypothetical protein VGR57_17965 [Ktedonobacterales bacterium]|nr:hypothetical protein [Ktedonobacterales bacterium]